MTRSSASTLRMSVLALTIAGTFAPLVASADPALVTLTKDNYREPLKNWGDFEFQSNFQLLYAMDQRPATALELGSVLGRRKMMVNDYVELGASSSKRPAQGTENDYRVFGIVHTNDQEGMVTFEGNGKLVLTATNNVGTSGGIVEADSGYSANTAAYVEASFYDVNGHDAPFAPNRYPKTGSVFKNKQNELTAKYVSTSDAETSAGATPYVAASVLSTKGGSIIFYGEEFTANASVSVPKQTVEAVGIQTDDFSYAELAAWDSKVNATATGANATAFGLRTNGTAGAQLTHQDNILVQSLDTMITAKADADAFGAQVRNNLGILFHANADRLTVNATSANGSAVALDNKLSLITLSTADAKLNAQGNTLAAGIVVTGDHNNQNWPATVNIHSKKLAVDTQAEATAYGLRVDTNSTHNIRDLTKMTVAPATALTITTNAGNLSEGISVVSQGSTFYSEAQTVDVTATTLGGEAHALRNTLGRVTFEGKNLNFTASSGQDAGSSVVSTSTLGRTYMLADLVTITAENAVTTAVYNGEGATTLINMEDDLVAGTNNTVITGNLHQKLDGTLGISFGGNQSVFTGASLITDPAVDPAKVYLAFGNGALWNMTADSQVTDLALSGAEIIFGGDKSVWTAGNNGRAAFTPMTLDVKTLNGMNSTFYMQADIDADVADHLHAEEGAGIHKLMVKSAGTNPTLEEMTAALVTTDNAGGNFSLANAGGQVDAGLYMYDLATRTNAQGGKDWYLKRAQLNQTTTPDPDPDGGQQPGTGGGNPDPNQPGTGGGVDPDPNTPGTGGTPQQPGVGSGTGNGQQPSPDAGNNNANGNNGAGNSQGNTGNNSSSGGAASSAGAPVWSPSAVAVLTLGGMGQQYASYNAQINDLRERLGEVRDNAGEGAWVRFGADRSRINAFEGNRFSQKDWRLNLGWDTKVNNNLIGASFKMSEGKQTGVGNLTGTSRSTGVNLYTVWTHPENGVYADFVLSADRFRQTMNTRMTDGTGVNGSYTTFGLGASAELGRRIDFGSREQWFAEPQVQMSYYWAKGNNYALSNGLTVDLGNFSSLQGRLGGVAGYHFRNADGKKLGEIYARTGLKQELLGVRKMIANGVAFRDEAKGTNWYYGAGADLIARDNLRFWASVEREHGPDYTKQIEFSIGMKVQF